MRFMVGMVIWPVVTTLEMTLPESEPKNPLDRTATLAGPPRVRPISAMASAMKNSPPPVTTSAEPKIRNPTSNEATVRIGTPMMLSTPRAWAVSVSGRVLLGPHRKPGMTSAKVG